MPAGAVVSLSNGAVVSSSNGAVVSSSNGAVVSVSNGAVLQVRRLRVASPYDGQQFVYRTKTNEYRADYYNGFIAAPDQSLTAALIAWISRTGGSRFASVVDVASSIPPKYVLEGNVTSLYGDYTDKAAKAVMVIKIFLFDDSDASGRVILQKEYKASAPIDPGSAESLVKGWGNAFRQILERITADLDAPAPAGL
jgi:ABC-type uncharacterized transport system auxiliary subunit